MLYYPEYPILLTEVEPNDGRLLQTPSFFKNSEQAFKNKVFFYGLKYMHFVCYSWNLIFI